MSVSTFPTTVYAAGTFGPFAMTPIKVNNAECNVKQRSSSYVEVDLSLQSNNSQVRFGFIYIDGSTKKGADFSAFNALNPFKIGISGLSGATTVTYTVEDAGSRTYTNDFSTWNADKTTKEISLDFTSMGAIDTAQIHKITFTMSHSASAVVDQLEVVGIYTAGLWQSPTPAPTNVEFAGFQQHPDGDKNILVKSDLNGAVSTVTGTWDNITFDYTLLDNNDNFCFATIWMWGEDPETPSWNDYRSMLPFYVAMKSSAAGIDVKCEVITCNTNESAEEVKVAYKLLSVSTGVFTHYLINLNDVLAVPGIDLAHVKQFNFVVSKSLLNGASLTGTLEIKSSDVEQAYVPGNIIGNLEPYSA